MKKTIQNYGLGSINQKNNQQTGLFKLILSETFFLCLIEILKGDER